MLAGPSRAPGRLLALGVCSLLVGAAVPSLTFAHPHDYKLGFVAGWPVGGLLAVCAFPYPASTSSANPDMIPVQGFGSIGGVCLAPDEVIPVGSPGQATIGVSDDGLQPVSAIYCQDIDGDAACGEGGEPFGQFCTSKILTVGPAWDPTLPVQVYVDGPVMGNPVNSVCDSLLSMGSNGKVTHS